MSQCVALVGLVLLRTTGGSVSPRTAMHAHSKYCTVLYVHRAETQRANQLFPADLKVALRTASLRRARVLLCSGCTARLS